tara:strand:+ start:741 stop:1358 length:618 start_codon:yes stop_codon:yes gene_type:complete
MILKNLNNRRLAIIGAGGHGKVIGEIALLNKYGVINFFDDKLDEIENYPFKIVDTINNLNKYINNYDDYFVAIGDNHLRSKKIEWLKKKKFNVVNLLHPQSIISKLSSLGEGTCVMANAVINPGVKIKDGVIINTSASIDHDCIIEDFAHISPNCSLSGSVKIGKFTHLGTGSSVHPGIKVGYKVKIGVGSRIFKNIKNETVFKN